VVGQAFGDSTSRRYWPADAPGDSATVLIHEAGEVFVDLLPTDLSANESLPPAAAGGVVTLRVSVRRTPWFSIRSEPGDGRGCMTSVSVTRGTSPHRCHSLPSMTFMQRL